MPDDNQVMLTAEGEEITVVAEKRHENKGGGGAGISTTSSADGLGQTETPTHGGGGGSTGSSAGPVDIVTTPADAAERQLEARLAEGNGTPEEALDYFQRHGFPQLCTLPTWNPTTRQWLFPQPAIDGYSDAGEPGGGYATFATTGAPASNSGGSRADHGSAPGGGDASVNPHGSWGANAGIDVSTGQGSSGPGTGGQGTVGTGPGGSGPGGPGSGSPGSSGHGHGLPGGIKEGEGVRPPWNVPGGGPGGPGGPVYSGGPSKVPPGGEFDGVRAPDGTPLQAPAIHFADEQLDGAFQDILDKNNPLLARMVLAQISALATIGVLVERYFVNPMLAAPAHLYAGLALEKAAAEAAARGDIQGAADDHDAATKHFREAAAAIAAVIPLGRAAGAGKGVAYTGERLISSVEGQAWALAQEWVTQSMFEHGFMLDGKAMMVDGFASRTGEVVVTNSKSWVAVEVKTADAIRIALSDPRQLARLIDQLWNYITLAQRLEIGGVRYVIVEGAEGAPMMEAWQNIVMQNCPELLNSGFIKVVFTPPPPPTFVGF